MRTKKVNRYWCDHCNKAGLSASAMTRHEAHCTLNPARNCRVCTLVNGGYQVGAERMAELVVLLPDPSAFLAQSAYDCRCKDCRIYFDDSFVPNVECTNEHKRLLAALQSAMPKLREETDDCPACIMAALRQRKIPVPMVESFNFTAEMKTVFANAAPEWP